MPIIGYIYYLNHVFMLFTPRKINLYLAFKLPAAFICGVRAQYISEQACKATVRHRWISQNPFHSMYFAVQAMAAELTTGILVLQQIKKSKHSLSMLVLNNKASFTKKATGKITFTCTQGDLINQTIATAIATGEGQTIWLQSTGRNAQGAIVAVMDFEWTLKLKTKK